MSMEQRLSFITLGVNDLEKVRDFYKNAFGWNPIKDSDGIVFFKLNGFILSLFPANELAEDATVAIDGQGFKRFTLAICMRSEQEVNTLFDDLKQKGVKIVKAPGKVFWGGYSGYVADIEDN